MAATYSHINAVLTMAATRNCDAGGFSYTAEQQALWKESADATVVQTLFDMGAGAWSRVGCMRAAVASSNDVQLAIDWCMEHKDEIAPPVTAGATSGVDDMGCEDDALLYVVVAPRSVDLKQDVGFNPEFILRKLHLDPHRHVFTRGFQHRNHEYWVCPNSTWVTFLGNQSAKRRWNGIDQSALDQLADSFRLERQ
eukprot:COSAG02_NODE_3094_length_7380_cov_2.503089_2_plen_196_part_00